MNFHACCLEPKRLECQHVLITGANSGLGLETAVDLARRGAIVHMCGRSLERLEKARVNIMHKFGDLTPDTCNNAVESNVIDVALEDSFTPIENHQLVCHHLDLASLHSVRVFANKFKRVYKRLDILINNAGLSHLGDEEKTEDGFEIHWQVNYLSHFLLTELLLEILERSPIARVINVTSELHKYCTLPIDTPLQFDKCYSTKPFIGYAHSKLACVMFAKEFKYKHPNCHTTCVCVRPNFASTSLHKCTRRWMQVLLTNIPRIIRCSPWQAVQTTIYCCTVDKLEPGGYYEECQWQPGKCNTQVEDDSFRDSLWDSSLSSLLYINANFDKPISIS